jgi:hypothetical protein
MGFQRFDEGTEYKLLRHAFCLELEYEINNKIP